MIFTVVIPHLGDEVFVQYELLLKVTATSVRLIVFPIEATYPILFFWEAS